MQAVVRRYGQNTLIQFEDFGNHNAFRLLDRYRDKYCTFNDDIQGTASVALAGLIASLRITKTKMSENKFLFMGAGEASLGIATLIVNAMTKDGMTRADAASRIYLCDSRGLLVKSRKDVGGQKAQFAKDLEPMTDFYEMVNLVKPTTIIGASAQFGAFNEKIIRKMGELNDRPVIFALSNPTSKAECTAEAAYKYTDGRAVFASGSPFPDYVHNGKTFKPGQGNNAYIFPGVALGVIAAGIHHISDDVFLLAARTLAHLVQESDLSVGRLYPPLQDIRNVSLIIAKAIAEEAYQNGTASTYPEPADKGEFIAAQLYDYTYTSAIPISYSWPKF
jgi:malate dehydrogenase (oxaloacetate-decarboxylating)(NADP+)